MGGIAPNKIIRICRLFLRHPRLPKTFQEKVSKRYIRYIRYQLFETWGTFPGWLQYMDGWSLIFPTSWWNTRKMSTSRWMLHFSSLKITLRIFWAVWDFATSGVGTSCVFIRSKVQGCSKSPFWPAPRRFNAAWYSVATTKLNVEVFTSLVFFWGQIVFPHVSPMNTFLHGSTASNKQSKYVYL